MLCFNPCFLGTRPRTPISLSARPALGIVSILVFLELALGRQPSRDLSPHLPVSILVFLELALGLGGVPSNMIFSVVSILVFLELALGP